ncbi:putative sugar isomerase YihS [Pseudoruegeria aquimaris]|uniref:Putative sugar isomerase YihS n=1 Tax=Pseudoruegeria aquimaris TaxID=393663 RepID=A0A1Y5RLH1_9RHOB|nr:AGE family epimerase/isomerase [Pseudoruegeria aquimaris]SLN19293.1 putative sugar isomerase YihS [Pseudoruegeria aquimaris]
MPDLQSPHVAPGPEASDTPWRATESHRAFLAADALRQFDFFRASLGEGPGFHVLAADGTPLPTGKQELHTTTRLTHVYALGHLAGVAHAEEIVDRGMAYLWSHHRDADHGGYLWALEGDAPVDARKLAYGHVFVLLAAASAKAAGHPEADRLLADVDGILDAHFWEEDNGLFCDEYNRDFTPFSSYRGMNANMHGVEALLAAFEATGREKFLERAGRILDFFMRRIAPEHDWRLPEHYDADWRIDAGYAGDPMFRPAGTTPGHSFELARLLLQYWDLAGRPEDGSPEIARNVAYRAAQDAWDAESGGLYYTLKPGGAPDIRARYWWPVTEAIGAMAALQKATPGVTEDEEWYRRLWRFASLAFIDHERGGWFPEVAEGGIAPQTQFAGKPDIYHAVQADMLPLLPGLSGAYGEVRGLLA